MSDIVKKTRTRLFVKSGIKSYEEAHQIRQELIEQGSVDGKPIDKVKVILRRSKNVFDVVAYGPQRVVEE